jgi:acetyl-CoA carboxylase biotin carboxyl carrier protein
MDFKQIQELIRIVSKSELNELKVEQGDFKITLKKGGIAGAAPQVIYTPQPAINTTAPQQAAAQEAKPSGEPEAFKQPNKPEKAADTATSITIKSPMIGTFYRSSGPDKDPFIKVGDTVKQGSVLCIIEAMKLFNEIECEYAGKIIKVLVEDASPVEYDQPLFIIDPTQV